MKAKLIFDLNEPDDIQAHNLAVNAWKLSLLILEFDNYLRAQLKYNDKLNEHEYAAIGKISGKLIERESKR